MVADVFDDARAAAKAGKTSKFLKWIADVPSFAVADGTPVPPDTVKGWLAIAIKAEAPTGCAEADAILDLMAQEEAARFGQWVLETWIAFDSARPTLEEADRKARAKLSKAGRFRNVKTGALMAAPTDLADHPAFEKTKADLLKKYANSGWTSRGVLALAVRAPGRAAALTVGRFIDRHARRSGLRSGQGKLVLALLAKIGDESCLEVLSTTASCGHAGLAQVAVSWLEAIRSERGWTLQELGDRAVSNAGLDDRLGVDLPWGAAMYRAQMNDALQVRLLNPAGKSVKALPAAKDLGQKETKKRLGEVKKAIAATIKAQTDRLYGEMCLGRVWSAEDWRAFIARHPILSRLAQRLVWVAETPGGAVAFRPTAEGDATNADDDAVDLSTATGMSVAHRLTLGDAADAWLSHFADYEIAPLFDQFSRAPVRREDLPDLRSQKPARPGLIGAIGQVLRPQVLDPDAMEEVALHPWPIGRHGPWGPDLMTAARGLGYVSPGTGKAFWDFPDLQKTVGGVTALLRTYGPPPSQPHHVAVEGFATDVAPSKLPPILLSELVNDLRAMLGGDPFASKESH